MGGGDKTQIHYENYIGFRSDVLRPKLQRLWIEIQRPVGLWKEMLWQSSAGLWVEIQDQLLSL